MRPCLFALFACLLLAAGVSAPARSSASTPMTAAQAIASVKFLMGTWHCTGDGPPEDDAYTFAKYMWRDTDSNGGLTTGTFDAKRQKWIVFIMNNDGLYAVNEGTPMTNDALHLTIPYPAKLAGHSYTFTKVSESEYKIGKQICLKK